MKVIDYKNLKCGTFVKVRNEKLQITGMANVYMGIFRSRVGSRTVEFTINDVQEIY